jgi:hypothetical protein
VNTTPPDYSNNLSHNLAIPLEFTVKIPPPLRTGVDYGFLPGGKLAGKNDKIENDI